MRWMLPLILLTAVQAQLPPSPPGAILIQPKPVSPKYAEQVQSWGAPMRSTPSFAPKVVTLPGFTITNLAVTGGQVTLQWKDGVPPFQVIGEPTLYGPWNDVGNPTTARSKVFPEDINRFFTVQGSIVMPLEATRTNNLTRLTWEAPDTDMSDSLQAFTLKRSTDNGATFPNTVAVVQPGGTYSVDDTTTIPPGGSLTWELLEQTLNGVVVPYSKPVASNATAGSLVWAEAIGFGVSGGQGEGSEVARTVAIDQSGNTWITTDSPAAGQSSVVTIVKNRPDGTMVFFLAFPPIGGLLYCKASAIDKFGNFWITGALVANSVDFGNGHLLTRKSTVAGYPDIYVAKFTSSGLCVGAVNYGSDAQGGVNDPARTGYRIAITKDGTKAVIVGACNGTVDFGNGFVATNTVINPFVLILNSSDLTTVTGFILSSTSNGIARSVALDSADNIYLGGYFLNTMDFKGVSGDSYSITYGNSAPISFLAKYSISGALLNKTDITPWVIYFGGLGGSFAPQPIFGIAIDSADNPVCCGGYSYTIDAGGGSITSAGVSPANQADAFVIKYLKGGSYSWGYYMPVLAPIQTGQPTGAGGVVIDASDNVIVAGTIAIGAGNANVTRTPTSPGISDPKALIHSIGQYDAFVVKYRSDGTFVWAYTDGTAGGGEAAWSVASDRLATSPIGRTAFCGTFFPGSGPMQLHSNCARYSVGDLGQTPYSPLTGNTLNEVGTESNRNDGWVLNLGP